MIEDMKLNAVLSSNREADLRGKPAWGIMFRYLNWCKRLGPSQPAQVMQAREIYYDNGYAKYRKVIDLIAARMERASSLGPFLSKRVLEKPYVVNSSSENADKDRLLNSEGIYHFHLGTSLRSEKLYGYTGDLLFVTYYNGKAYFLGIGNHNDFDSQEWAQRAISNWPNSGMFSEIKNMTFPSYSESERALLRKSGAATFVSLGGKSYFPATGSISTAGISAIDVKKIKTLITQIKYVVMELCNKREMTANYVTRIGQQTTSDVVLTWRIDKGHLEVVDKTSGVRLQEWFLR